MWLKVEREHMGADAAASRKWDFNLWESSERHRVNGALLQGALLVVAMAV